MRELSLNILDVAQNSVSAGATRIEIDVLQDTAAHTLLIQIADNGRGMDEETVRRLPDPFYTTRTTRKVGMGVPLFKMAAEMTGGSFDIQSAVGAGTTVTAVFRTDSVDFTPLGDVESSVCALVTMNEQIDFVYTRRVDGREFVFASAEIREMLDGVPLNEPAVMTWLAEYLAEHAAAVAAPQK
ncbi:MAG: sensor histidine kinase [Clostridia bacterium]|nr:sensor histidine kinase [Clostridia bacterium]